MLEARTYFFSAVEKELSSAELLLLKPIELEQKLNEIEKFLKEQWPSIFSTLTEKHLTDNEKLSLKEFLTRLTVLEEKVHGKIDFFKDFQKYVQVSLDK